MATRKTKTISEENVEEDSVNDSIVEPAQEKKIATKVKHDPSELIVCRSVTFGELVLIGPKTNMQYSWSSSGDTMEVEYQDLAALKATRSNYIFKPYFIIEDEDLYAEWKKDLEHVYVGLDQSDLRDIFDLPQKAFLNKIKNLSPNAIENVKNTAYAMMRDGSLYDLRKIKAMDEILGTELTLMIG